ncbi:MAG: NUDIX hydrolase N-terminal domain-containing protein [Candidatus Hatepunaea meridiana]|nr:NUDIX hydrolase N-terminal domain-containing protein [Candidatus Hatepunaea meridiana]
MQFNYQDALINILDEIQAIARTGLNFTENPYDREHYERLLEIACVNLHQLTGLDQQELSERFAREIGYITPKVGVNAAIFDDKQRILLQKRTDNGKWGLPSGWVEVGEKLLEAIVREVKEETGLDVEPTYLLNVYDSKAFAPHRAHNAVGFLYLCESKGGTLAISHESTDIGYFEIEAIDDWHLANKTLALTALNFIIDRKPFSAIEINNG